MLHAEGIEQVAMIATARATTKRCILAALVRQVRGGSVCKARFASQTSRAVFYWRSCGLRPGA
eukprot:3932327-Amphidinium_carterae.1